MVIPLVDLKAQYAAIKPEIDRALTRVVDSHAFILGREVQEFEEAFAAYCGTEHAVGVASGTAALHLALLAAGIGAGDEVITTPLTFVATAEAICHAGARPVFVDIDPATYNLDPRQVEAAITPRTRAILPVHLYGQPADLEPLLEIAARRGVRVIEDAAQAHGARYKGRRVGSFGDAAAFSFFPGKNLGAYGDGGMVVTNSAEIAARVRMLRDHGRHSKYEHEIVGFGERLDALQAAVLKVKLPYLDTWNAQRRRAAGAYRSQLRNQSSAILLPHEAPEVDHVYHLFVIRVRERDRMLHRLQAAGVRAGVHYPIPVHLQPAYVDPGYSPGRFPHAEQAAQEVLSLPLYPEITDAQIGAVTEAVMDAVEASDETFAVAPGLSKTGR